MEKIPTAVEWLAKEIVSAIQHGDKDFVYWKLQTSLLEQALKMEKQQRMDKVKFAKLHVKAALKEASEKAKVQMGDDYIFSEIRIPPNSLVYNAVVKVNKDSILNSYSLDNIK